jgi:hypothetical protein
LSPRITPKGIASVYEQPSSEPFDSALAAVERAADGAYLDALEQERHNPYASGRHS